MATIRFHVKVLVPRRKLEHSLVIHEFFIGFARFAWSAAIHEQVDYMLDDPESVRTTTFESGRYWLRYQNRKFAILHLY